MSFGYTLLPTLHRAVFMRKRVIWLHLVTDAASRGFPVLACDLATPCYRRCIAWFPSVSTSYGYTLNFGLVSDAASRGFPVLACHLAAPCDRRCIVWFPCDSMSFGYTLNFDLVTDAASRGFPVLTCPSVGVIRPADPENPRVEPNMKWIGRPLAEIWIFEISQM